MKNEPNKTISPSGGSGHVSFDELFHYHCDALPTKQRIEVERHLFSCEVCKSKSRELYNMLETADGLERVSESEFRMLAERALDIRDTFYRWHLEKVVRDQAKNRERRDRSRRHEPGNENRE